MASSAGVKRSGVTACLADYDGTDIAAGGIVVSAADGGVAGHDTSAQGIGRGLAATDQLTADALALVSLDIPDGPLSYAYANTPKWLQLGHNPIKQFIGSLAR